MQQPRPHTKERASAGLPLSVGAASTAVRVLLAAMFLLVAVITFAGGLHVGVYGPVAAAVIAVVMLLPFSVVALVAAAFVLAPYSRFGVWLDAILPALTPRRALALAAVIWTASALLIFTARAAV